MNLINSNRNEVKTKRIKKFLTKAFNLLNGKINPIYPARKIVFKPKSSIRYLNSDNIATTLAQNTLDYVLMDPHGLKEWILNNNNVTEIQFRGLLLCILAHELSHMDQRYRTILTNRDNSYPEKGSIESEIANDRNTIDFLTSNYKEISHKLGNFDIQLYKLVTVYTEQKAKESGIEVDNCFVKYGKINSVRDRLLEILSVVTNLNFYKLLDSEELLNISYIRLSVGNMKKVSSTLTFPVDVLLKPLNGYLMFDIKDINGYIADELLGGYEVDLTVSIESMDNGNNVLVFDYDRFSKRYPALETLYVYSIDKIYSYENDPHRDMVIDILEKYTI